MKGKKKYNKIVAARNNEINTLSNKIKCDKLTCYFKSEDLPISFNDFNCPLGLIGKIKDSYII